jgi:ferritin
MLDSKLQDAINDQVNFEFYSSYLYLSMSSYYSSVSLNGFANWMRIQAQEELVHAMKLYDYIIERGGRATLEQVNKPVTDWNSPIAPFEQAYGHEQIVTSRINELMDLALKCKDHATVSFLKWFIDEQVEEEARASTIVDELKLVKDSPNGLFMINRELAQRVFVMPGSTTNNTGA